MSEQYKYNAMAGCFRRSLKNPTWLASATPMGSAELDVGCKSLAKSPARGHHVAENLGLPIAGGELEGQRLAI